MSVFSTDQEFKSREEMMEWVQNTARDVGYVIVTKRSRTKPNGYSKVILMCERGGVYRSVKGTSKATGTKKINCPFELIGAYTKMNDCWKLVHIRDEHNHPPAQHMEGHAYVERLSRNEFQLVADLTKKHVAPRDILGIIKEQNGDNVSTLKTVYNARNKIRKINHKGKSPMQVVMSRLQENGYTYYTSINSISNELESLFFAHQTSLDLLRAFPHVMLMDATYKTNKYNIPFLEIIGVTSTSKTFSIAFAFMHKETKDIYVWVLHCLKSILDNCMQPRVIVTDREFALMNACQQIFPDATQLLCRFHISQSIFRNCKSHFKSKHKWESFTSMWSSLIESSTLTSFKENYKELQSMLTKYPGIFLIIIVVIVVLLAFSS
ncbi:putative transcription factor FAR family [Helianthus anomalus]